jgi:Ca2+-transporting ATPase
LANQIGNVGIGAAICTFIAMVAIWLIYPETREEGKSLFDYSLKAFIMGVTIVVVAVPEGLPLAVTLSLAYSTQKMMADNNLIRVLAACETMGNATNICSDKTGTLTQNKMTVVEGWVGGKYKNEAPVKEDISVEAMEGLCKAISVNSTAVLINNSSSHETIVSGSKTEGALLMMLLTSFNVDYAPIRASSFNARRGDRLFTFSSARKKMSVLMINGVKKNSGVSYTKGAAEVIVACATRYSAINMYIYIYIHTGLYRSILLLYIHIYICIYILYICV